MDGTLAGRSTATPSQYRDAAQLIRTVGRELQLERKRRGLSYAQVARELLVDHSTLWRLETAEYPNSSAFTVAVVLEWLAASVQKEA